MDSSNSKLVQGFFHRIMISARSLLLTFIEAIEHNKPTSLFPPLLTIHAMTYKTSVTTLLFAVIISSCASTTGPQPEQQAVNINDFPTRDRVEYVLECIAKNGGLNFATQHACTCMVDKIAEKMSYKEYAEARTFTFLRSTPGEKGAVFRDPKHANKLREQLKETEKFADENCFIR